MANKTTRNAPVGGGFAAAWRILSWILPVLSLLLYFAISDPGWEGLIMIMLLPIIIPVVGMLNVTPLLIMRRKGITRVPTKVAAMMVAHWVSFVLIFFGISSVGDSTTQPSAVRRSFPYLLSYGETAWQGLSVFLTVLLIGAAILYTTMMDGEETTQISQKKRLLWVSLTAFCVIPVMAFGSFAFTLLFTAKAYDSAGDNALKVMFLADAQMRKKQETNYDQVQRDMAELRKLIAEDYWLPTTVSGVSSTKNNSGLNTYKTYAGWERNYGVPVKEIVSRIIPIFENAGWEVKEEYDFEDDYWGKFYSDAFPNQALTVSIKEIPDFPGTARLWFFLEEGNFYKSMSNFFWVDYRDETVDEELWKSPSWFFTHEEWPSLLQAENAPASAVFRDDEEPAKLNK